MSAEDSNTFYIEPVLDFSLRDIQEKMKAVIQDVRKKLGHEYPLVINGKPVETGQLVDSVNPGEPTEVVGKLHFAGEEHARVAVESAAAAFDSWSQTAVKERVRIMQQAALLMRERRMELAVWQMLECGKNWAEADADVCEAIDFLEYYPREMLRLAEPQAMEHLPGEGNVYFYEPRGVALVIAPWNFPLAILTGMSSAALITGNTVVYKPSGQSSVIAAKLMEIYQQARFPPGVVNYLPGKGSQIGDYLVRHPAVSLIAFTGSKEVGLHINRLAAEVPEEQHFVKRLVLEMGGKNAVIVDATADIDEAIKGVVISAFGYQGQKCSACSRVIVHQSVYESFVERLVEATRSMVIGKTDEPETFLGPLIDEAAVKKTREYIELGKKECRLLLEVPVPEELKGGYFVGPVIFDEVGPTSRLAQEEIFAPVLSVFKVSDFNTAIQLANSTAFALTGGLYSRTPEHIEQGKRRFQVGNLYINRKITAAIVGRQPFGGFRLSGVGSKAGGPDYLLQFMNPRTVTENLMRHGFAPLEESS